MIYLDRTGSANETAPHVSADGRLTIMVCAFEGARRILRSFRISVPIGRESGEFKEMIGQHYGGDIPLGARQIVKEDIDLMQTAVSGGCAAHRRFLSTLHGSRLSVCASAPNCSLCSAAYGFLVLGMKNILLHQ